MMPVTANPTTESSTMKRVTVSSFISAVKRTETVPKRCLWVKERIKPGQEKTIEVCAIGALCVDRGAHKQAQSIRSWAASAEGLGLEPNYISGFITGFDGRKALKSWDPLGSQITGFEDGLACAYAAFDEKLHEEYTVVWADDPTPWMEPGEAEQESQYVYCGTQ